MQNLVVVQHQLNFHKEQRIKTQNGIKQSEYFENRHFMRNNSTPRPQYTKYKTPEMISQSANGTLGTV